MDWGKKAYKNHSEMKKKRLNFLFIVKGTLGKFDGPFTIHFVRSSLINNLLTTVTVGALIYTVF